MRARTRVLSLDGDGAVPLEDPLFPDDALAWLSTEARSIRCLVEAGNGKKGSGVLVGPGTVLTVWHVVAVDCPGQPQQPAPKIRVLLADGRRLDAVVAAYSNCTDEQYDERLPANDAGMDGFSDVVLLRLTEPVGIHLGFARLGTDTKPLPGRVAIAVLQYPEGLYKGVGLGKLKKPRGLTGRWGQGRMPSTFAPAIALLITRERSIQGRLE